MLQLLKYQAVKVRYVRHAEAEIEKHFNFIRKFQPEDLDNYRK